MSRSEALSRTIYTAGEPWSDAEVCVLLSTWGDQIIQDKLDKVVQNKVIYNKIASQLREKGFGQTGIQCCTKIKNLVQRYKKVHER